MESALENSSTVARNEEYYDVYEKPYGYG